MKTDQGATHELQEPQFADLSSRQPVDWPKVGFELEQKFQTAPIHLVPPRQFPRAKELEALFPNAERIFAVDFYVAGAERGSLLANGAGIQVSPKIFNIDHHAPLACWERHISSGNLACRWVESDGIIRPGKDVVVINHTDCDSVIAALILVGALPPCARLEEAVIDADHRGRPNPISDLLQSTSESRDIRSEVSALARELQGQKPIGSAKAALEDLQAKRLLVKELVKLHTTIQSGVALVQCATYIDSDLFLSELPDAKAIVIGCRSTKFPELEITRVRLGNAAPQGVSLHALGLQELDPFFGGRWNAGSNKRGLTEAYSKDANLRVVTAAEYYAALLKRLPRE